MSGFAPQPRLYDALFRPLDEQELQRLDDDALIDYLRRARAVGDPTVGVGLAILVYGHWLNVERRVRMKVPAPEVEDVTADIIAGAIISAFDGSSVGEFVSWLNTITQRTIADFYRRGPGRLEAAAVDDADGEAPSEIGAIEVRDAIERVMATMRPDHRAIVDIVVFEDRSATDAAAAIPDMTEANVHQIVSRFRRALRGELEADGDTGTR